MYRVISPKWTAQRIKVSSPRMWQISASFPLHIRKKTKKQSRSSQSEPQVETRFYAVKVIQALIHQMPYGQTFRASEWPTTQPLAVVIDIAVNALSDLMRTVGWETAAQLLCEKKNLTQVGLRKPLMRDGIALIRYRFFSMQAYGCAL